MAWVAARRLHLILDEVRHDVVESSRPAMVRARIHQPRLQLHVLLRRPQQPTVPKRVTEVKREEKMNGVALTCRTSSSEPKEPTCMKPAHPPPQKRLNSRRHSSKLPATTKLDHKTLATTLGSWSWRHWEGPDAVARHLFVRDASQVGDVLRKHRVDDRLDRQLELVHDLRFEKSRSAAVRCILLHPPNSTG